MATRDDILERIRKNTIHNYEMPDLRPLEEKALAFDDKISAFKKALEQAGGKLVSVTSAADIAAEVEKHFPDARRVAVAVSDGDIAESLAEGLKCGTFGPDSVGRSADLNGTDVAVVDGCLGVCENGAVWIMQSVERRAIYFISEALVIVLDHNDIVNNMHEAYERIDTGPMGFGVFVSGPSKTADIEQALVFGAHGPRDVVVMLK